MGHRGIRVLAVALVLLLAIGVSGCGTPSSWSASPVIWGEKVGSGVIVRPAQEGETMEVGENKETAAVYAHIEFYSEEDSELTGEAEVSGKEAAVTERTVCTLNGESREPSLFGVFLNELQSIGGLYSMKIEYLSGAATKVTLAAK